ncbi:adenosine deaminase [Nocardioides baculatus]|uniref:Adenosine deaminase n=1 Tax=Nocardioides baculatus TaxID=2801337 RepID=A0ABS1L627_9ACTN|nr:adenosine deaminase [Nocardioides baculatus]MBL0747139.1 adenosine deaminase [Nocardioides baculatus]
MNLQPFIAGLPKAELHVHHVGSASPRIVSELAARHPGAGVPRDLDGLKRFFTFRDFAHFIVVYLAVVDLIRTPEDIRLLTYEVAREMAEGQNLRYAELTCTPYTSVVRGLAIEAYTEAIEDARVAAERDFGLVLRWIYDIPGESGIPAADATLEYALAHRTDALVGFGLGGPEIGVPRAQFQEHFDQARAAGLHSVPHAGETTGPETIWESLRLLGAERIGHGCSAAQDPELLAHLAGTGVVLEVCPTSNVATRAVDRIEDHPLRTFVDAGVSVTINSDDPPMFSTSLNHDYEVAAGLLDLDEAGVADLARAAVAGSFAPDDVKTRIGAEIDDYEAAARRVSTDTPQP